MITVKQLAELTSFEAPESSVVSLYLEITDWKTHPRIFQKMLAEATPRLPGLQRELQEDVRRIEEYLAEPVPPGFRGLAVFSSKRHGLWHACPLPQPVKDRILVGSRPRPEALLAMARQYHRYGVALVCRNRARFLEAYMGQITEYEELRLVHRGAGHAAPAHDYLKSAADMLAGLSRANGCDRVILGAAPALVPLFIDRLRPDLEHNLILDPRITPGISLAEALDRIVLCEREARKVRESVLVHRLLDDAAAPVHAAVVGLHRTLDALQKGQARLLLVRDGFAKMGRACRHCGALSIGEPRCPACRRPTEAVFNLVEELVSRAIDQGCEVFRLLNETPLDNVGRIGAELAFSGAAAPAAPEALHAVRQAEPQFS